MPTSQDDVRSRGEDWKSPVLYQMTRLPGAEVNALPYRTILCWAQIDAYDKRYHSLTARKSVGLR